MAISYSIDVDTGIILEVWSGDVSAYDLKQYWKTYLADPHVLSIRKTLADLRNSRILFKGSELSALIEEIVLPILNGRDWKTAVLVEKPVQYGVSRQYQTFSELYSKDSIFYDFDAALAWLKKQ